MKQLIIETEIQKNVKTEEVHIVKPDLKYMYNARQINNNRTWGVSHTR